TAPDLAAAVAGASVAITMLPDTPDVVATTLGTAGLAELMPEGSLVIDMSTIAPGAAADIGARLARKGIAFLDAPVSGGTAGAVAGTLSIMAGGEPGDFARAEPLLACMGQRVVHAGPWGTGQIF